MAVPHQKLAYLNRKSRTDNEKYVNFIQEPTFNILNDLNYGSILVYFYLCSLVPHTIDGKVYKPKETIKNDPYEISPQA